MERNARSVIRRQAHQVRTTLGAVAVSVAVSVALAFMATAGAQAWPPTGPATVTAMPGAVPAVSRTRDDCAASATAAAAGHCQPAAAVSPSAQHGPAAPGRVVAAPVRPHGPAGRMQHDAAGPLRPPRLPPPVA